jgi:uncharacterized membrane-anchored protein YhcB (DUF1043 family)
MKPHIYNKQTKKLKTHDWSFSMELGKVQGIYEEVKELIRTHFNRSAATST